MAAPAFTGDLLVLLGKRAGVGDPRPPTRLGHRVRFSRFLKKVPLCQGGRTGDCDELGPRDAFSRELEGLWLGGGLCRHRPCSFRRLDINGLYSPSGLI